MTCDRARELMVATAVDDLGAADRLDLESHLGTCAACAGDREGVTALIDRLKAVGIDDPGPAYWAAYNRRIRGRIDATAAVRWRGLRRHLPAAAAALLVVAVAIVAIRRENGPRSGGPAAPGSAPIAGTPSPGSSAASPASTALPAAAAVETDFEGVLTRAAATSGTATVQRVLDDMLSDDPWILDDDLTRLSAEERETLVEELTGA